MEQAVPVHRRDLEWLGRRCLVLALRVARYRGEPKLYVFHSWYLSFVGFVLTGLSDAPIIMCGVTILALISYFVMPESAWLPSNRISHFIDSKGVPIETVEEVNSSEQGGPVRRR